MVTVIGVRFKKAGKIYYFDPDGIDTSEANHVIVETARGIEFGHLVVPTKQIEDNEVVAPLKKALRVATEEDIKLHEENQAKKKDAFSICVEKIKHHNLEMKLIDVEYTFDNNKVIFYFTSDGRVDFRDLVKDLASVFRTRIELRQIGVRDGFWPFIQLYPFNENDDVIIQYSVKDKPPEIITLTFNNS